MKPTILDLFCGVGGAAMGYHRAGFNVVGVDSKKQPHYPFAFIQADVFKLLPILDIRRFAAVHASPPCQRWSEATGRRVIDSKHPDAITPTRELLTRLGLPYVIENVKNAPLHHPTFICGTERRCFAKANGQIYRLKRHRYFETNWTLITPGCRCIEWPHIPVMDATGGGRSLNGTYHGSADARRAIMGIPWGARHEIKEAVPPAYTELIGRQLINLVTQGGRA